MEYYDIHCHIIPNVDDGSESIEESLLMLKNEYNAGVRNIIATPHRRIQMFEPDEKIVKENFELLKERAKFVYPDMRLYLGREYHANIDMLDDINKHPEYLMANSEYLLLEFSSSHSETYIRNRIREACEHRIKVIVAHCERYRPMVDNMDFVYSMTEYGAMMQVNSESILGKNGYKAKQFCKKLIRNDLLSFVASDAHGIKYRRAYFDECVRYMHRKMGKRYTDIIFHDNPSKIMSESLTDEPKRI